MGVLFTERRNYTIQPGSMWKKVVKQGDNVQSLLLRDCGEIFVPVFCFRIVLFQPDELKAEQAA